MLNKIIKYFLENKLVTVLVLLLIVAWGIVTAPFNWETSFLPRDPVPVDAIPDIGENQQIVFTEWMGRSPQDVEDQITYPLTTALLGLFLLGSAFSAVGLAASALTRSPALAAGGSFLFLLFAWVLRLAGRGGGFWGELLPSLSPLSRLESFAIGRLAAADIAYFVVLIACGLLVAQRSVDRHRWQG